MSGNNKDKNNRKNQKFRNKWVLPAIVAAAVIAGILITVAVIQKAAVAQAAASGVQAAASASPQTNENGPGIIINKKDITSTAAFIPYQAGSTKMEIIAVKADDGTVRTSMNTCQVCWDSGRGTYKQQGNELVCQNCGNRFNINSIEKIKNGCNPVPITSGQKTESNDTVTITGDTLATFKQYFKS